MKGYIGESPIDWKTHPELKDMTEKDWALLMAFQHAQVDGAHHKTWVIDQMVRILNGAEITVKEAEWASGETVIRWTVGSSDDYIEWVKKYADGEDGPETYEWEEGIAP